MLWAILSIAAGLGDAIAFASIKKLSNLDTYVKLTFLNLIILPFLALGFFFYEIPQTLLNFYIITLINVVVFLIAMFLIIKSLEMSDLSLSIPMLSFTPVFLLFTSYILLRELPNLVGFIGVFVVVIGSYVLNIASIKYGYFEPLKSIFKNKSVFNMLVVAFLFSITASLSKIGIKLSNPAYFMFVHYLFASIFLIILFFKRFKYNIKHLRKNSKYFIIYGIAAAFSELLAATALIFTIVPYVISLKRISVIFSVIIGLLFFQEKNFKEKIVGTIIMFAGATLIILS
jgi:uncharacterized membrane protein